MVSGRYSVRGGLTIIIENFPGQRVLVEEA